MRMKFTRSEDDHQFENCNLVNDTALTRSCTKADDGWRPLDKAGIDTLLAILSIPETYIIVLIITYTVFAYQIRRDRMRIMNRRRERQWLQTSNEIGCSSSDGETCTLQELEPAVLKP
ncbi:hypothetical protein Cantr_03668 [Candida viswanathii]|uniref:Uncharacterized protein n=1 Tax=Candida viswanathii TaxID=5486 RepID=A0A367XLQ0_9ASCO|nr:hypothetical protein Cantr_03668 [Candida viswanathii]